MYTVRMIIKAGTVTYKIDFFAAEVITGVETMTKYLGLMEEQLTKAATDDSRLLATCEQLSRRRDLRLRAKHLSGNSIEKAKIFLKRLCNFEESVIEALPWPSSVFEGNVRDCIVHTSGEVSRSRDKKELETKNGKVPGYSLQQGEIWLQKEFCEWALPSMEVFFRDLFKIAGFGPLEAQRVEP